MLSSLGVFRLTVLATYLWTATSQRTPKAQAELQFVGALGATSMIPNPWKEGLMRSMRASPSSGVVTLATVEKGRPRARTVLFQGLINGEDGKLGIAIKTSAASRKIVDADSPLVEIVWWMEESYMQYRFSGPITYEGHENDRRKVWDQLGAGAQEQFYFPVDKATPLDTSTSGSKFQQSASGFRASSSSNGPPDNFKLGVLYPDEVDILNLGTLERQEYRWQDGSWQEKTGYAPPVVSTSTPGEKV